jgi:hypothetical protein
MGQVQSFAYNLGPGIPEEPPKTQTVVDVATCVYDTPLLCDMAIGLVFFNPAKSKRMLMNYLYTVEKLKCANTLHRQPPQPFLLFLLCFLLTSFLLRHLQFVPSWQQ